MYSHTVHYRPSYCPAVQQLLFLRLMMFPLVALFDYSSRNFYFIFFLCGFYLCLFQGKNISKPHQYNVVPTKRVCVWGGVIVDLNAT